MAELSIAVQDYESIVPRQTRFNASETDSARGTIQECTLTGVHTLPLEIIAEIIWEACSQLQVCDPLLESPLWNIRPSLSFSRVCRQWRAAVLCTARFWTDIHIAQADLALLCIRRSQEAEITLHVAKGSWANTNGIIPAKFKAWKTVLSEVIDLVMLNAGRIRALDIQEPFWVEILNKQDNDRLLTSSYDIGPAFAVNHSLSVPVQDPACNRIKSYHPLATYPQLRSLSLSLHDASNHALKILITMQGSPALEKAFVTIATPLTEVADKVAVVPLKHLRHLTLKLYNIEDIIYFLARMEMPALARAKFILSNHDELSPLAKLPSILRTLKMLPLSLREVPTDVKFFYQDCVNWLSITAGDNQWWAKNEPVISMRIPCAECRMHTAKKIFERIKEAFPNLQNPTYNCWLDIDDETDEGEDETDGVHEEGVEEYQLESPPAE